MNYTLYQYLFVDIIAVLFMYSADRSKRIGKSKRAGIYVFLSAAVLLFQLIFRDVSVGTDYRAYINLYLTSVYVFIRDAWTGNTWMFLCRIFALIFGTNYLFFFAFVGIATVFFFYKAILYENKYAFLGIALYLAFSTYYQSFNQFRQTLAVAIILFSWRYIKSEKWYLYFLFVGLASLMHTSAAVMFPVYFVAKWEINFKNIIIYIIGSVILIYGFETIIGILKNTSYAGYIGGSYDGNLLKSAVLNTALRAVMLIGCMLFKKDVLRKDESAKSLYNLVIICMIVQVLTLFSQLFARVSTYFFVFYILLIPKVLEVILEKVKEKGIIYVLFFIVLLIYHNVYYLNTAESYGIEIYKFLWS